MAQYSASGNGPRGGPRRPIPCEAGHHLDYTYLKLADSFHTEGFFKRESSLFYQLVPSAVPDRAPVRPPGK